MKKILSLMVAALLLIGCLCIFASAAETQELVTVVGAHEIRNNFPGWVGGIVQIGEKDLSVTSLGRMIFKGNSGTHEIKLVDFLTNEDIPGGIATVDTSEGTEGQFLYAELAEPVTLLAGRKYYILSNEVSGGDMWAEFTTYGCSEDAAFCGTAYWLNGNYNPGTQANGSFVGLSFEYAKLDTATPPPETEPPVVIDPPPAGDPYVPGETIDATLLSGFEHFCVKPQTFTGPPAGFAGYMGAIINTGDYPLTVSSLGRLFYEGNTGEHTIKLVDAATGADVEGSAVTVNMEGGEVDQIVYADLAVPITLAANSTYYLLSSEDAAGDSFGDCCDNLFAASGAAINGYVYHDGSAYQTLLFPSSSYLTLDMKYTYTPTVEIPENSTETEMFGGYAYNALRNDYHSFIGIKFVTGADPLLVTHLGRFYLAGNVQEHVLKLVDAETGLDVPGGSVTVYGGTPEEVTYVALEAPITLEPNHLYYLLSREYAGGDMWFNNDAKYLVNFDDDCTMLGGTWQLFSYEDAIMLNQGFVGLNLKYQKEEKKQEPKPTEPEAKPTEPSAKPTEPTEPGNVAEPSEGLPTGVIIAVVAAVVVAAVVVVVMAKKKKKA